jgi:hypothetical protein
VLTRDSTVQQAASEADEFSSSQILILFFAFFFLTTLPVWTHRVPPVSDYANHLARMHVIATLQGNAQLGRFYEVDWQIIPNLVMDLIVPTLARFINVYLAGQIFTAVMFLLIASGVLVLGRSLFGRWPLTALLCLPFLYNYVFLVGLMNYIFGIGVALWGLAGWVALREKNWLLRFGLSTAIVIVLLFSHLSALGLYGIGVLSAELLRLWDARFSFRWSNLREFGTSGLPFVVATPLLLASPTLDLAGSVYWDQFGKIAGLMYVISDYSELVGLGILGVLLICAGWASRHQILSLHGIALPVLIVGSVVYLALPRVMFDTFMADQRVPLGIAFILLGCVDLRPKGRSLRTAFVGLLILVLAVRLIEVDVNWSTLSEETSQLRSSFRKIERGSKVFVAYANASAGEDVADLGLVHAACLAVIERSALVTTLFTVVGKQVLHVRPEYRDFADIHDGTPPSIAQMIVASSHPLQGMPEFWLNWPKFDYVYVLYSDDDTPNPDSSRLRLIDAGDRFQLYRVVKGAR